MRKLKKVLALLHGKNKNSLQQIFLANDDDEKIYNYNDIYFYFSCANYRVINKMTMYVNIPIEILNIKSIKYSIVLEDYFLRILSERIINLNESYRNINKDVREKGNVESQVPNEIIVKRNGAFVKDEVLCLKISCLFPLINGSFINGKSSTSMIRSILKIIDEIIDEFNIDDYRIKEDIYWKQEIIRQYIKENNYIGFVGNNSILPRENGTSNPVKNAIPFLSPKDIEITIDFPDGSEISGMGIKKGITVITGGGYSGKSTLLDAIEMGIYNHVTDDGREFVITENTALKIYAEDGRPVNNLDMSPFFKYFPNDIDVSDFSTHHGSGSVSQAANIIEAVCGGCKLLLIDEDRSATNFMIRDANMRKIVSNEPIIPFTDRIRELYSEKDVSTILVIGGASQYLSYASKIVIMENYTPKDITNGIEDMNLEKPSSENIKANWEGKRFLKPIETKSDFIYFRSISNENSKKIILDEYSADITLLTALISTNQLNSLAYMMEKLLTNKEYRGEHLIERAMKIAEDMYLPQKDDIMMSFNFKIERWFEEVRPIDIFCCANRMRGLNFKKELEDINEKI